MSLLLQILIIMWAFVVGVGVGIWIQENYPLEEGTLTP